MNWGKAEVMVERNLGKIISVVMVLILIAILGMIVVSFGGHRG